MMRSWENRPDTAVIDEPFYSHYLWATGIDHPMATEVMQTQPQDWRMVANSLTEAPVEDESAIFYQKHISTHLLDHMELDWTLQLTNSMLIRDPARMVASYAKKRDNINARDFGYAEQLRLFEFLTERNGEAPLVIDTDRLLKDPQNMLHKWCDKLNIDFLPEMLSWPAGKRDSDGIWGAHWYDAVEKSTGFVAYKPVEINLSDEHQQIADACRPAYEKMLAAALSS